MKKSFWGAGLFAAVLFSNVTMAQAQAVTSPSANANLTVVQQLTVTKTADLAFGSWVAATAVSYRVNADATGTATGSTGRSLAGTRSAARFQASGVANAAVQWTFPATITVTGPSSTNLTVTPVLPAGATGNTLNATLDATGVNAVLVGGTITTPATAPPVGAYSGTFVVNVDYQ